jgi:hypothetical protein
VYPDYSIDYLEKPGVCDPLPPSLPFPYWHG